MLIQDNKADGGDDAANAENGSSAHMNSPRINLKTICAIVYTLVAAAIAAYFLRGITAWDGPTGPIEILGVGYCVASVAAVWALVVTGRVK